MSIDVRARQEPDQPDASPYGPPRPIDPFPQPSQPGPEPVVRPAPPERPKPPTT